MRGCCDRSIGGPPVSQGGRLSYDCERTRKWVYEGMRALQSALFVGVCFVLFAGCQPESKQAGSELAKEAPAPVATVNPEPAVDGPGVEPSIKAVTLTESGEFEITYEWEVKKKMDHDWRIYVHFTDLKGYIKFQNDHDAEPSTSQWEIGKVQQGPKKVKIPEGFEGDVQIRMGLYDPEMPGAGSKGRKELAGTPDLERRIIVGRLLIGDAALELLPID